MLRPDAGNSAIGVALPVIDRLLMNMEAISNAWNQWVLSYDRSNQLRLLARLGLVVEDWQDLIGLLAASLALSIAIIALLTLHPRVSRDPIERCYQEFCQRIATIGVDREAHETANTLLARAGRHLTDAPLRQAHDIVALYNELRYGGAESRPPAERVRHLRRLVNAFRP